MLTIDDVCRKISRLIALVRLKLDCEEPRQCTADKWGWGAVWALLYAANSNLDIAEEDLKDGLTEMAVIRVRIARASVLWATRVPVVDRDFVKVLKSIIDDLARLEADIAGKA